MPQQPQQRPLQPTPPAGAAHLHNIPESLHSGLAEHLRLDVTKIVYLLEALRLTGNRLPRLRQVRVVQRDKAPSAAVQVGEAAYLVDMLPTPASAKSAENSQGKHKHKNKGDGRNKRGGPPAGRDKTARQADPRGPRPSPNDRPPPPARPTPAPPKKA